MKKIAEFSLCLFLLLSIFVSSFAYNNYSDDIYEETARNLYETVDKPNFGSVGGEWTIIGLSRGDIKIEKEYYENYYLRIKDYVISKDGKLSSNKSTEYSRLVLALSAIGKNPKNVGGYNLLTPLYDYETVINQGVNAPIWALIAINSKDYAINEEEKNICKKYVDRILEYQNEDGGFKLMQKSETSEIDITAMALIALNKYKADENINLAINNGLNYISKSQNENGGFVSFGYENPESSVQTIVALLELGIDLNDERFVKKNNTLLDNLLKYYLSNGKFSHDGITYDLMSTEQAFYALSSLKRFEKKQNSLYNMNDVLMDNEDEKTTDNRLYETKTFSDISDSYAKSEIEKLAGINIINGINENEFNPNGNITRAEFSKIIVKALNLESADFNGGFADVLKTDWFYDYVLTANKFGIVNGIGENMFNPNGFLTREEACVMLLRAAKIKNIEASYDETAIRNILSGFTDYIFVSHWATNSVAFCYENGILNDNNIEIKPSEAETREEVAFMIYNLLNLIERF